MKKTNKPPRELLKKSHAHKSKKDYERNTKHSDEWSDHFSGMNNLSVIDWEDLPNKTGGTK